MRKFHSIALVVSLGLSLAVAPSVQAKAKPKAFNGKTCTIVGTSKSEKLNGTSKADVICGLGGNDTINGLSGTDTIDGGTGNDILSGGENNDAIDGGTGNDTINGGNGNDSLTGDSGNDSLLGGAGNDALQGETGADVFSGGTGTDTAKYSEKTTGLTIDIDSNADDGATGEKDNIKTDVENITGGSGNDAITGSSAANTITGGSGNDTVSGGTGGDTLNGGGGSDSLTGDSGNDTINGGASDDTLSGGLDDDSLNGDQGADDLNGGPGINPCFTDLEDTPDVATCGDVTAPRVTSFSFTPTSINTASASAVVTVNIGVRDDLSGISTTTNGINVGFKSPYGVFQSSSHCDSFRSSYSGSTYNCILEITIPRYSHVGTWEVCQLMFIDQVSNQRSGGCGYAVSAAEMLPANTNLYFRNGPS